MIADAYATSQDKSSDDVQYRRFQDICFRKSEIEDMWAQN